MIQSPFTSSGRDGTGRWAHLSGGDATLLSSHAGRFPASGGRQKPCCPQEAPTLRAKPPDDDHSDTEPTLRVRLLVGASPDAPAAEVDDLGRRTASPAVTLVVHAHALAAPHAVDGVAELRRIDLAGSGRSGFASAAAGCHRTCADFSRRHVADVPFWTHALPSLRPDRQLVAPSERSVSSGRKSADALDVVRRAWLAGVPQAQLGDEIAGDHQQRRQRLAGDLQGGCAGLDRTVEIAGASGCDGKAIHRGYVNSRIWKPAQRKAGLPVSRENGTHARRHFDAARCSTPARTSGRCRSTWATLTRASRCGSTRT